MYLAPLLLMMTLHLEINPRFLHCQAQLTVQPITPSVSPGISRLMILKVIPFFGQSNATTDKTIAELVHPTEPNHSLSQDSRWYTFTTKTTLVNTPPVFGTPSPTNGSTGNQLNQTWSIPINDPQGNLFSWTIQCNNRQNNSGTSASNGTKSLALSGLTNSTTYKIWVNATDPTVTTQQQNVPPNKPNTPSGNNSGKIKTLYTYTTSTTDPNGDQVYYLWDWGDGSQSDWLGPYNSGIITNTMHKWTIKGSYSIKVKAKDIYGKESVWSEPLPITMPYSYKPIIQFLELLFQRFPHAFPILRHLVGY